MRIFRAGSAGKMLVAILGYLALFGCAVPGNELPKYTCEQLTVPTEKVAIDYHANFLSTDGRTFQDEVEKVFRNCQMFASNSEGVGTAPYHFTLTAASEVNIELSGDTACLSCLSLFILPKIVKVDYVLTADVWQDQILLKQYRYQDHVTTYVHLWSGIFIIPFHRPPLEIHAEVIDNMLMNFLAAVEKDGLLKPQITSEQ